MKLHKVKIKACRAFYEHITPARINGLIAVVVIVILAVSKKSTLIQLVDIDIVSSISLTVIVGIFVTGIVKFCEREIEDALKVEEDSAILLDTYEGNEADMLEIKRDSTTVKLPIMKLAWNYEGLTIGIEDQPDSYYRLPTFVEANYIKLFNSHKYSQLFNKIMIRLSDYESDGRSLLLRTMRTTYYDSMVTNRAADTKLTTGISIRSVYEPGNKLVTLKKSRLSNHLGMNGIVISADHKILMVKRCGSVSIAKRKISCSCSSAMKSEIALDGQGELNVEGLTRAIKADLHHELGLDGQHYIFDIDKNVIGLVRGFSEVGKPEICFYVRSNLLESDLLEVVQSHLKENKCKRNTRGDAKEIIFLDLREDNFQVLSADYIKLKGREYPITPIALAVLEPFFNQEIEC